MRLLFYVDPLTELDRPDWKSGWLEVARRLAESACGGTLTQNVAVICGEALAPSAARLFSGARTVFLRQSDFIPEFGASALQVNRRLYERRMPAAEVGRAGAIVRGALGEFSPEVAITFSPAPHLKAAFPRCRLFHYEYGMFSRLPYPETAYLDPLGMFRQSAPFRLSRHIREFEVDPPTRSLIDNLRSYYGSVLLGPSNPFADLADFWPRRRVLLPLQFSNFYAYDSHAVYASQLDLLYGVLEGLPPDVGVVVTEHPEHPVLTANRVDELRRKFPNFIWSDRFSAVYAASQYLLGLVDAAVSVSSSVGWQTLLWRKPLVVLGSSHLDTIADGHDLKQLPALGGQPWPEWKDRVLAWLLTRYFVPFDILHRPGWLPDYLGKKLGRRPREGEIEAWFKPTAAPHELAEAFLGPATNAWQTPLLARGDGRRRINVAAYVSRRDQPADEQSAVRVAVLLQDAPSWQELLLPFAPQEIESIRFDPADCPCTIRLAGLELWDSDRCLWSWLGDISSRSSVSGMDFMRLNDSGWLLHCAHDDPQLQIPYRCTGAERGAIRIRFAFGRSSRTDVAKIFEIVSVQQQALDSAMITNDGLSQRLVEAQQRESQASGELHALVAELKASWATVTELKCERERALGLVDGLRAQLAVVEESARERAQFDAHRIDSAKEALDQSLQREAQLREARGQLQEELAARNAQFIAQKAAHVSETVQLKRAAEQLQTELRERVRQIDAQTVQLASLEARLQTTQRWLDALQATWSWKVTAPLRALRRAIGLAKGIVEPRQLIARFARAAYRAAPLPISAKGRLKNAAFASFPAVFGGTMAYRIWRLHRAELSSDTATASVAIPERKRILPGGESGFGPPSPAAAAENGVLAGHAAARAVSVAEADIEVADGRWEWLDYEAVRGRVIGGAKSERMSAPFKPMTMLDFSASDLQTQINRLRFPAADSPIVSILIPTYNNLKYTVECLASIVAAGAGDPYEVVIADDASSDRTAQLLSKVEHLRVMGASQNVGFLLNVNRALPQLRGRYVVLLNNDVQVCQGWLDRMLTAARSRSDVGAVGPKIVYPNGQLQEAGCSFRPDCSAEMIGLNESPGAPQFQYRRPVDYASGACLLVDAGAFRNLGGFDENFAPAYCEDSDLCLRLREQGLKVIYEPSAVVIHHLSKTTAAQDSDAKLALVGRNLDRFAHKWQATIDELAEVRLIAFYLPQFHPIAENDLWWGRGFTEWRNVARARPNFAGHYQPRVPADLGYYDLRVSQVMQQQGELAKRYGIYGFCIYYYWFAGKRLLDMPIERLLQTGQPDIPFCLCWANENWTRRWDGQEREILMSQAHSDADDIAVIKDLIRYMRHDNYIRIDGKPLLAVYRVTLFPDFAQTAQRWRSVCRDEGLGEIYLAMVESFEMVFNPTDPARFGCDAAIEFPPQGMAEAKPPSGSVLNTSFDGQTADYRDLAVRYCLREQVPFVRFRGLMPGWDNTARRQDSSFCFEHATPGAFQAWAEYIIDQTRAMRSGDERIVFINAWNEWAEGAYLEPDRRFGHSFLEAIRNAKDSASLKRGQRYAIA